MVIVFFYSKDVRRQSLVVDSSRIGIVFLGFRKGCLKSGRRRDGRAIIRGALEMVSWEQKMNLLVL